MSGLMLFLAAFWWISIVAFVRWRTGRGGGPERPAGVPVKDWAVSLYVRVSAAILFVVIVLAAAREDRPRVPVPDRVNVPAVALQDVPDPAPAPRG